MRLHDALHRIINQRFAVQNASLWIANFVVDNINLQERISDLISNECYSTQYRTRYRTYIAPDIDIHYSGYENGYDIVPDIEYDIDISYLRAE
jgi:hypothetical protein